ncbi:Putative ribonuclease H protein At1g65750, partial [Linum perenne]
IRDDSGRFVQAFTAIVGDCSITRAELSAIVQGLKLAWAIGLRKIVVQSDSSTSISILQSVDTNHQHAILVADFQELKSRNWDISIVHVFRESELLANSLAAKGHDSIFRTHLVEASDPSVAS